MKSAIKNSDAISFMYEEVAKEEVERGEMCYLDIEDFSITRPLYFIYPSNSLLNDRIESFYGNIMES